MASYQPTLFSCEICGEDGLGEQDFREHTLKKHLDENAMLCPFCELTATSGDELNLHVNQAHLDFLTPESEVAMGFIDDSSPSDCNGFGNRDNNIPSFSSQSSHYLSCNGYSSNPSLYKSNINNINISAKVNGGGEMSPRKFNSHSQGSPLRSSLDLHLRASVTKCPMCSFTSGSPDELQEHVNRKHFDLTSPSVSQIQEETYSCPLCIKKFSTSSDLELHVNIEHRDILSPLSPASRNCPVCDKALDKESNSAALRHVESHFTPGSLPEQDQSAKERERKEFEMLRAQYGMDNQGNFKDQFVTNMQKAVYAGEMSVTDYYEKALDLKVSESSGIDDCSSVTRSIVPRVRAISGNAPNVVRTLLCTCVDHFASSYGDRGWGCGYRNTQMLLSSLLTHTGFNERLYKMWRPTEKPARSALPSISRLQWLIEQAWAQGFDIQGSEQLGCKLVNTRKWIGATEVATLLSSLRIKCQLIDFHRPTEPDGTHPELFKWVLRHFESNIDGEFTPPLYLQHQGHSRTIMGIEVHKDGTLVLLVLDPSHSPQNMAQFGDTNTANASLRLLRKGNASMKAKQYQILTVAGTIDNEQQYQQSKVLRGLRIPQDR